MAVDAQPRNLDLDQEASDVVAATEADLMPELAENDLVNVSFLLACERLFKQNPQGPQAI